MDFDFSADQELLRDSVRRYLAERAPITPYVRDRYSDDRVAAVADDVWLGLAELGVVGLLVPEEHGGAGGGMVDAAVVLEELGRAVCPVPYASSAIGAVSLVMAVGSEAEHATLLPGLADGSTIGTLALYEDGRPLRVVGAGHDSERRGRRVPDRRREGACRRRGGRVRVPRHCGRSRGPVGRLRGRRRWRRRHGRAGVDRRRFTQAGHGDVRRRDGHSPRRR